MTTPPQLTTIDGFPFPVAASPGAEPLARTIAARCERAHSALRMTLDFDPKYTLLVLNETDWPAFAAFPLYAMPHNQRLEPGVHGAVDTTGPSSLIVGANRGSFFDEVSAIVVEDLGDEAIAALRAAYPSEAAPGYDLSAFADMLVIHELGHLFEMQVPVRLPRRWMSEFFANLCLHAAIAAAEPELSSHSARFPRSSFARRTSTGRTAHSQSSKSSTSASVPRTTFGTSANCMNAPPAYTTLWAMMHCAGSTPPFEATISGVHLTTN